MTAVPYLLALLAAKADDDADTVADLRDLLGDEGAAGEALRHAEAGDDEGVVVKSARHAPAGGVTVQGTEYRGGEFIPAEVMANATAEEKAAVGGGGDGDGDRTTPPAKEARRAAKAADVAAWAADIEVSDTPVVGKAFDRDDLDSIEGMLNGPEQQRLERFLDSRRDEYVSDYDPEDEGDLNADDAAKEAGWSDSDIDDAAKALLADKFLEYEADDPAADISEWYSSTSLHGTEAIDELADHMDAAGWSDDVVDAIRMMKRDAANEIESKLDEERGRLADEKRNDYDTHDDRREWLQEWYDEHDDDERISGEAEKGRWGKDSDNDWAYHFATSDGSEYKAHVVEKSSNRIPGVDVPEFVFSDSEDSVKVTGKAGAKTAMEVFANVTPAAVAILTKNDYDAMQFSAAEPSRQKLYDRLVRSTTAAAPEYAAVAVTVSPTYKKYMLVKRDKMGGYMDAVNGLLAAKNLPADAVEHIVKGARLPAGVVILPAASDDDIAEWNKETAWEDEEPDVDPTRAA